MVSTLPSTKKYKTINICVNNSWPAVIDDACLLPIVPCVWWHSMLAFLMGGGGVALSRVTRSPASFPRGKVSDFVGL